MATADPFYDRKPVPKELIGDIGITGLDPQDEFLNRERKYSKGGSDIRNFSNPTTKDGKDPFYQRKKLSDAMIAGIGETGLTSQEEHLIRERKYSLNDGSDARKFSNKVTPQQDPFYGRKKVNEKEISGVGETGNVPAQDYGIRERKQSMFQLSDDPFSQLTGSGHRQSISAASTGAAVAASERRRSSAVGPHDIQRHRHHHEHEPHGEKLEPIESRAEDSVSDIGGIPPAHAAASVGNSDSTTVETDQPNPYSYHDDPDSIAPHEMR